MSSLSDASALMQRTQLELEAKGYTEGLAKAAIERARGIAQFHTRYVSAGIREQAFCDILAAELGKTEEWVIREQNGMASPEAIGT